MVRPASIAPAAAIVWPDHRLIGADGDFLRPLSPNPLYRQGFYLIVLESRSPMSINVVDILRRETGVRQGPLHGKNGAVSLGMNVGYPKRIG